MTNDREIADFMIIEKVYLAVIDRLRHKGVKSETMEYPLLMDDIRNKKQKRFLKMRLFGFPALINYQRDYTGERFLKVAICPPDHWNGECPDMVTGLARYSHNIDMLFVNIHSFGARVNGGVKGSLELRDTILNF